MSVKESSAGERPKRRISVACAAVTAVAMASVAMPAHAMEVAPDDAPSSPSGGGLVYDPPIDEPSAPSAPETPATPVAPDSGSSDELTWVVPSTESTDKGFGNPGTVYVKSSDSTQHEYRAYLLLSAEVDPSGYIRLPTMEGCMSQAFWKALGESGVWDSETSLESENAQVVAEWMSRQISADNGDFVQTIANLAVEYCDPAVAAVMFHSDETVELASGYYAIIGEDNIPMVMYVGGGSDVTVQEKASVPTVSKQVGEVADDGSVSWGDYADASVGVDVPYRLIGTLPTNYDQFATYGYRFVDTLEDSLTVPDASAVKVYVVGEDGTKKSDITQYATSTFEGQVLTVSFEDLKRGYDKRVEGDTIVVEYVSQLVPGKADIGVADGNDNEVFLEYSKNPAFDAMGRTVTDDATVYSFEVKVDKVDSETKTGLAGAKFVISDDVTGKYYTTTGKWQASPTDDAVFVSDASGVVEFIGLDSGSYTVEELTAPDGYVKLTDPVAVTITSTINQDDGSVSLDTGVVHSSAALVSVDANKGILEMQVANTPIPEEPEPEPTVPDQPTPSDPATPATPTTTVTTPTTPSSVTQQGGTSTTTTTYTPGTVAERMPQLGSGPAVYVAAVGSVLLVAVAGGILHRNRKVSE